MFSAFERELQITDCAWIMHCRRVRRSTRLLDCGLSSNPGIFGESLLFWRDRLRLHGRGRR
eukprot:10054152-Alexandrium_andersonii.AAC.1